MVANRSVEGDGNWKENKRKCPLYLIGVVTNVYSETFRNWNTKN